MKKPVLTCNLFIANAIMEKRPLFVGEFTVVEEHKQEAISLGLPVSGTTIPYLTRKGAQNNAKRMGEGGFFKVVVHEYSVDELKAFWRDARPFGETT